MPLNLHKNKFNKNLLFKMALMASVLLPTHTHAQTVQDAVQAAIINHPQVEQAKARLGIADEGTNVARSGFFPELSVGLTAGRIFGDNSTSRGLVTTRGAAYSGLGEVNASLQQPIFDGFETMNRLKSSQSTYKSANLRLQDMRGQIAYQTVQAYLDVLQARSILLRIKEQEIKVKEYLERINLMVNEGAADEGELQQAQDVRALLKGFVADYTGQLKTAESEFIALTDVAPFNDMKTPILDITHLPGTIEEAIALTNVDHPAILALVEDGKAAEFDAKAEKGILYPDVLGELSYLKSDKREEIGGEVEDRRAVLRMNWNFETGGGQYARIKQRKLERDEVLAREKEVKRQIAHDVRVAYTEYDVAITRLNNQKEREELNKDLFDTFETQFEGGRVSVLQLMQADNQLFNTSIEKTVYQYRLLAAKYAIVASLGRLQDVLFHTAALESYPVGTNEPQQ